MTIPTSVDSSGVAEKAARRLPSDASSTSSSCATAAPETIGTGGTESSSKHTAPEDTLHSVTRTRDGSSVRADDGLSVRRVALLLLACAAVPAVAFAVRSPHAEKRHHTRADIAFARRALLQQSDVPDWVRTPVPKTDSTFACPGYDPDLSRFTITGEAEVIYAFRTLDQISSSSEVYPSRAQAVGDFKLGATPAFAGCLHRALVQGLHTSAPGLKIVHASARAVGAPKIGERAVAYRLSATV